MEIVAILRLFTAYFRFFRPFYRPIYWPITVLYFVCSFTRLNFAINWLDWFSWGLRYLIRSFCTWPWSLYVLRLLYFLNSQASKIWPHMMMNTIRKLKNCSWLMNHWAKRRIALRALFHTDQSNKWKLYLIYPYRKKVVNLCP